MTRPSTDDSPIEKRYRDARGTKREVSSETLAYVERALRLDEPSPDAVRIVRSGQRVVFDEPADLVLEDGSRESLPTRISSGAGEAVSRLPGDVPLGYHAVELHESGRRVSLIVAPRRCHLPEGLRIWAWAVQLYSARSRRSWGMGDFGDLARLGAWASLQGCGMLLVNPLHAAVPTLPQTASPYSPSTRRYLNPLYLALHDIPGASQVNGFTELMRAGTQLNRARLIDRDRIFRLKMRVLDAAYRQFEGDQDFDAFAARESASLREYATFCALAEQHGGMWRTWPAKFRDPRSADVRRFADAHRERVRFHQWVQWHLDRQLARAAAPVPVMQDLPIGIDPNGADAWAWQDVLAEGVSVGAPPDEFNTKGQNWGLPPFVPGRLRAAAYRPFIETIRGTMRHAGGLRIDHVMGLYRLFWIPEGASAAAGAYVRNMADDLLAIVALESARAEAIVVGEDLGTIEQRAQQQLLDAGILSYRLLWFEKGDPAGYPEQALAAVTTHDLPTIAGLWTGSDLAAQRQLDLHPNEEGTREIRARLARFTRSKESTPIREVIRRTYRALSRAPSVVVAATLEDAAAVEARPNMPGTVTEWPNWCQPLPVDVDTLCHSAHATALARVVGKGRRSRRRFGRRASGKKKNIAA